ncbi:MAG: hydrolase [Propionicimonas sp.]|uniref:hydrolase n=1 Tax=Propionicimonas sp. TaxID=1955623 RepID=UPI003D140E51
MIWICAACGVETADAASPPATCAICEDERQWVPESGQAWTTLAELAQRGTVTDWFEVEPDLFGVTAHPGVGIGQQTMIVRTAAGVLVFDPLGFIDAQVVDRVRSLGPVLAVAASHPHMYGCGTEWAAALDTDFLLNGHDREWCRRDDRVHFFDDAIDVGPDLTLHRVGGHFRGQTVAEWRTGNAGRGVLLAGDAVFPNPDRRTVSFQRSFPNRLPLSGAVVQRIAAQLDGLHFDRLYNNFGAVVPAGAKAVVRASADRHAAWADGRHDDETW